ncbi:hypothetical protein D3C75_993020 [compost metagenome]
MACTIASIPVAAVICAGRPEVNVASRIATSAYKMGETIPVLVVSPVVTIEMGVTSEPVPAVVGIRIKGRRGPLTLLTP